MAALQALPSYFHPACRPAASHEKDNILIEFIESHSVPLDEG